MGAAPWSPTRLPGTGEHSLIPLPLHLSAAGRCCGGVVNIHLCPGAQSISTGLSPLMVARRSLVGYAGARYVVYGAVPSHRDSPRPGVSCVCTSWDASWQGLCRDTDASIKGIPTLCCLPAADICLWLIDDFVGGGGTLTYVWQSIRSGLGTRLCLESLAAQRACGTCWEASRSLPAPPHQSVNIFYLLPN